MSEDAWRIGLRLDDGLGNVSRCDCPCCTAERDALADTPTPRIDPRAPYKGRPGYTLEGEKPRTPREQRCRHPRRTGKPGARCCARVLLGEISCQSHATPEEAERARLRREWRDHVMERVVDLVDCDEIGPFASLPEPPR